MDEDAPIVPPPGTFTVDRGDRKPVLYLPDGRPLVRDQIIGFKTSPRRREEEGR